MIKKFINKTLIISTAVIVAVVFIVSIDTSSYLEKAHFSEDFINTWEYRLKPALVILSPILYSIANAISYAYVFMNKDKIVEKQTLKIAEANNVAVLESNKLQLEQNNLISEQNVLIIEMLIALLQKKNTVNFVVPTELIEKAKNIASSKISIDTMIGSLGRAIISTASLNLSHSDRLKHTQEQINYAKEQLKKILDPIAKIPYEMMLNYAEQTMEDLTKIKFKG